jgi:D-alanine-D-alanine ligase
MRIALTYNEKRSAAEAEAEFDTRATIDALIDRLARLGHTVVPVDVGGSIGRLIACVTRIGPDVIFDLAEGERGAFREAFYPALFEQLGFACTGSSPSTRALCLDKWLAERIVAAEGIAVPGGIVVRRAADLAHLALEPPWIVKPNFEGSSKGITAASVVDDRARLGAAALACLERYPEGVLVERYVDGLDVAVGWVDGLGWLPPIAYRHGAPVFDYALKHVTPERVRVEIPAALDDDVHARLLRSAQRAFAALGVSGYGRADFRVTPRGEVVFLEINPLPSLADGELFAAASAIGASPEELLACIVRAAHRGSIGQRQLPAGNACLVSSR